MELSALSRKISRSLAADANYGNTFFPLQYAVRVEDIMVD